MFVSQLVRAVASGAVPPVPPRLPPSALNFKQSSSIAVKFYRCTRPPCGLCEPQRSEMHKWVKEEFVHFKNEKDPQAIKMLIAKGKMQLKELESSVGLMKYYPDH
ncbi:hypothetical protein CAOG_03112 [Capsaspora owczarzaki ATCC 30864]|uniref:hypothetical protein n=1 Tax=Capsaspora owczarzaki (strain ATCC 30864) TaxID=595528 RepID=UPI0003522C95|nr:hypothetical protein CAOG_03112 [Capsaspora owczarzaki ATCC 30864]|eukprot:XP_004363951.2 hypothetical protein CAOG_03112 [Capsaspora owczarzaki ATCC 30864]